jgi:hypothetical protein
LGDRGAQVGPLPGDVEHLPRLAAAVAEAAVVEHQRREAGVGEPPGPRVEPAGARHPDTCASNMHGPGPAGR